MTRVLTYNIHSGVGGDGEYDVKRVASVVASVGASIVCLQEVESNMTEGRARVFSGTHSDDQPSLIAQECGLEHVFFSASVEASVLSEGGSNGEVLQYTPGIRYGNCILSKYPILKRRVLHYRPKSLSMERIYMDKEEQPRNAQAALLDAPELGGKVWIVNTHFCHLPWRAAHKRQARQLLEWIEGFYTEHPILLCGDFNSPPSFPWTAYRILLGENWWDLCSEAGVTFPSAYYRKRPTCNKWLFSRLYHAKLDHILTNDPRLQSQRCQVVHQTPNSVLASDHCGLWCEVIAPPKSQDFFVV